MLKRVLIAAAAAATAGAFNRPACDGPASTSSALALSLVRPFFFFLRVTWRLGEDVFFCCRLFF